MNTFFFGIGIISLVMAVINIACPKVIEKFYKEYSREDVKKYARVVAMGNALFGIGIILVVTKPEILPVFTLTILLLGVVLECMACLCLKHKKL